jgi:hypothetical protein
MKANTLNLVLDANGEHYGFKPTKPTPKPYAKKDLQRIK